MQAKIVCKEMKVRVRRMQNVRNDGCPGWHNHHHRRGGWWVEEVVVFG